MTAEAQVSIETVMNVYDLASGFLLFNGGFRHRQKHSALGSMFHFQKASIRSLNAERREVHLIAQTRKTQTR